jgi:hypothetical protein
VPGVSRSRFLLVRPSRCRRTHRRLRSEAVTTSASSGRSSVAAVGQRSDQSARSSRCRFWCNPAVSRRRHDPPVARQQRRVAASHHEQRRRRRRPRDRNRRQRDRGVIRGHHDHVVAPPSRWRSRRSGKPIVWRAHPTWKPRRCRSTMMPIRNTSREATPILRLPVASVTNRRSHAPPSRPRTQPSKRSRTYRERGSLNGCHERRLAMTCDSSRTSAGHSPSASASGFSNTTPRDLARIIGNAHQLKRQVRALHPVRARVEIRAERVPRADIGDNEHLAVVCTVELCIAGLAALERSAPRLGCSHIRKRAGVLPVRDQAGCAASGR